MKVLRFALLFLLASCQYSCYAWTDKEWVGVTEAVFGAVVLRPEPSVPSDVCENCGGSGRLGDGTVSVECPICKGTGRPISTANEACASCANIDTIPVPQSPGKEAPIVKQDAATSDGGNYKPRFFRR